MVIVNSIRQLLYISLVSLFSCSQNTTKDKNIKEFEGMVTYKITYNNFKDSALYGDTLKIYYSKGNMLKQYNNISPNGLKKEIFLTKGCKYYFKQGLSDSLFTYDLTSRHSIVAVRSKDSITNSKILNYLCKVYKMDRVHLGKETFYIYDTYTYSDEALKVNPEYFKELFYGDFNSFISKSGSLFLKYEVNMRWDEKVDFGTKIYQAINIKQQKVDSKMFLVDISKIKEFKVD